MVSSGGRVLVTGGGSGIGAAVARRFGADGAQVTVCDLDTRGAEGVAAAIVNGGGRAEAVMLDVTDAEALEALADRLLSEGGLDHVICCAGIASRHTIPQMSADQWRRVVDVNLTGVFLTLKAGARVMRGGLDHRHLVRRRRTCGLYERRALRGHQGGANGPRPPCRLRTGPAGRSGERRGARPHAQPHGRR